MDATAPCLPGQLSSPGCTIPTSHQKSLIFPCNTKKKIQEKVGNNSQMTTALKEWHEIFQDSLWKLMSYFPKSHSCYRFTSGFKDPPANSYAPYLTVVGLEINEQKLPF